MHIVVVLYMAALLEFEAFIRKFFHFCDICKDYGALLIRLEPNGGGGENSWGLFYCLIIKHVYVNSTTILGNGKNLTFQGGDVNRCKVRFIKVWWHGGMLPLFILPI